MPWNEKYNAWEEEPETPKKSEKAYPSLEELEHMLDDEVVDEDDDSFYFWSQSPLPPEDEEVKKAPPKGRNRKHLPKPEKDDFYREKLHAILIYLEESTDQSNYRHDFFLSLLTCFNETRHLSSRQKEVIDKTIEELDLIY